jgi:hypothetical protein
VRAELPGLAAKGAMTTMLLVNKRKVQVNFPFAEFVFVSHWENVRFAGVTETGSHLIEAKQIATKSRDSVEEDAAVPECRDAKLFQVPAVMFGRDGSSILVMRNASSYSSRPRLRSQSPRSCARQERERHPGGSQNAHGNGS